MSTELYSHNTYKGYHLFVESIALDDDDVIFYEGVAQHNGTTLFTSKSLISGNSAECILKDKIDEDYQNDCQ